LGPTDERGKKTEYTHQGTKGAKKIIMKEHPLTERGQRRTPF